MVILLGSLIIFPNEHKKGQGIHTGGYPPSKPWYLGEEDIVEKFLLRLVMNKLIIGQPRYGILSQTFGRRDHPIPIIWS